MTELRAGGRQWQRLEPFLASSPPSSSSPAASPSHHFELGRLSLAL